MPSSVSSHPLDGAEHNLARHRDTSTGELLASGRTDGSVKVSGLVTNVDKRVNKNGAPWAIVTIADRNVSGQVLFFARSWQAIRPEDVTEEQRRVRDRDGASSVFGEELTTVDVSAAECGSKPPMQLTGDVPVWLS